MIFKLGRWMWIWREKPGVISEGPCWVCVYGYWMHCAGTLWELADDVIRFWKHDSRIVG